MIIGFIGLGTMGKPMCRNIIKKAQSIEKVLIYDLYEERMQELLDLGACRAFNLKAIATECHIIITMVPKDEHVVSIYKGLLPYIHKGTILIDMSTISPNTSVALAKEVSAQGAYMLDAPVVKSEKAAIEGELGIYVGGSLEPYHRVESLLFSMGKQVIHLGGNGSGLSMKICHNLLVGHIQNGVNETLSLAVALGIAPKDYMKSINMGGGQNFYLDTKGNTITKGDFLPAFSVENMHKDLTIAMSIIEKENLSLRGSQNIKEIYDIAMEMGFEKEDFSVTYKIINAGACKGGEPFESS